MVFANRWMKPLARLVAGLLLFAQIMVSAQACNLVAQPNLAHALSGEMPCPECDETAGGQNVCLAHYLQDSQARFTVDVYFLTTAALSMSPTAQPARPPQAVPQARMIRFSPSGPPLQILFCSYQT